MNAGMLWAVVLLTGSASPGQLDLDPELALDEPVQLSVGFMDNLLRNRARVVSRNIIVTEPGPGLDWLLVSNLEVRGTGQLTENVALTGSVPFGFLANNRDDLQAYFANLKLGVEAAWRFDFRELGRESAPVPRLGLGFSFDTYFPTSTDCTESRRPVPVMQGAAVEALPDVCVAGLLSQQLHPFEPELYIQDAMLFRSRLHVDFRWEMIQTEAELSLSPGFTIDQPSVQGLLYLSWAARLSVLPIQQLELYTEVASTFAVVAPSVFAFAPALDSPAVITFAGRLHLASASFDPALFASVDLDQGVVSVGLDLAGVIRNRPQQRARRYQDDMNF